MVTNRKIAIIAGVLLLTATVVGILSVVFTGIRHTHLAISDIHPKFDYAHEQC